jgi:hypothetical protein
MKKSFCFAVILSAALAAPLCAAEDEDALFGGEETVVDVAKVEAASVSSNIEGDSVSLSGIIYDRTTYSMKRDWFAGDSDFKVNSLLAYIQGDLMLDIRLRKNIKAFVNLSAYYSPQGQRSARTFSEIVMGTNFKPVTNTSSYFETVNTLVFFKEFFLDANLARAVYFRVGKQVLQWGRGYFWNPTDLINIQRKDFFNMSYNREGAYGLKLHVPFGTAVNLYSFADFSGSDNFDTFAMAGKAEFLLGATEFALSAWGKKHSLSVYGLDFSSRIWEFDVWGEFAASYGDNRARLKVAPSAFPGLYDFTPYQVLGRWVGRASLGLSTAFDIETPDRLTLTAEFFWNSEGYTENMLSTSKKAQLFPFGPQYSLRDAFFSTPGVYTPGQYGRYYAAVFASFSKFFVQDLTWTVNALANLNDFSGVLSTGWFWAAVYNFNIGLSLNAFLGGSDTEYGMSGNAVSADLSLSINF